MKRKNSGFSIVELLTVLAIIALLVGILVPALSTVRTMARETKQRAQFAAIGQGLIAFRTDFGDYPESLLDQTTTPGEFYEGGQKLAEALVGWDLLGFHPDSEWQANGEYENGDTLYDNTVENLQDRKGPYLELSNSNAFKLLDLYADSDPVTPLNMDTFVLCDSFGRKKLPVGDSMVSAGSPILYFKANRSSKTIEAANLNDRIYNVENNLDIGELGRIGDGAEHRLFDDGPTYNNFYDYIIDEKVSNDPFFWPVRADSYILISAGADGLYGTGDDVTNF
ncbi:type II secretion system protein [Planctomycetota bacterium]